MNGQRVEIPVNEAPPLTPEQVAAIEADQLAEGSPETPDAPAPVEPAPQPAADPTEEADSGDETNQAVLEKFSQEFAKTNQLSEESFAELAKLGYPRKVVEQYIEGARAIASRQQSEIYGLVGGEQAYSEMSQWAAEALSESEINAFNSVIATNNPDQVAFAVKSLQARYQNAQGGREPKFVTASGRSASAAYESVAQLMEAMGDPRYKTDEAYRNEVARKLAVSSIM